MRSEWDVTVLTNREKVPWIRNDGAFLASLPPSLSLRRVGGVERLIKREKILKGLYTLGLPEFEFLWILPALWAGKALIRKQKYDIIHSWACCHASNVVGLLLKRFSGLPWVAHFSDPWVDNPYSRLTPRQARISRRLEEAVIREADAVVFTTTETVELVMGKYPAAWRHKAIVVPHGYDADFADFVTPKTVKNDRLRMLYTGAFYGPRSPESLLRALQLLRDRSVSLSDLEMVFVGSVDGKYREMAEQLELNTIVSFTGQLTFMESLQHAAMADVLLVIDAPSETQSVFLPSKLVDYLMFEKAHF